MKKRTLNITLASALSASVLATTTLATLASCGCSKGTPVSEEDKANVNNINTLLKDTSFDTMHELVTYLNLNEVDLEGLQASDTNQYVWDSKANIVFIMNTSGDVAYAPEGYTLNSSKNEIWKMVNYQASNGTTETFKKTCDYGQYLRSGQQVPKDTVEFSTSIDTGSNEDFKLKYVAPESITYTPKVVTYCADLEIQGSLGDIEHYGHAKSITVTQFAENSSYKEFGTVDSNIVISGSSNINFVAEPTADINTILVDNPNVSIKVTADSESEEAATVGSVARTDNVTAEQVTVTTEEGAETPTEQYKEGATEIPTEESEFAGGLGTVKSPYIIKSSKQLFNAAAKVNSAEDNAIFGFKLISDIRIEYDDTHTQWTPIGSTQAKPFRGVFDGNGYTISNLKITGKVSGASLIGYTDGEKSDNFEIPEVWDEDKNEVILDKLYENNYPTSVKNVTVDEVDIQVTYSTGSEGYYAGGIIGYANNTFIFNNTVKTGTISGYKHVGGITGTMTRSTEMACMAGVNDKTANPLNITASIYNVGGITGSCNRGGITSTALIGCETGTNTYVKALNNDGGCVGGICGYDNSIYRKIVVDCVNNATVESNRTTTETEGTYIAGICARGSGTDVFANCVNNGTVKTTDGSYVDYIAGITTNPGGVEKIVKNCVNNGTVKGYATYGVAGVITDWDASLKPQIYNCSCPADVEVVNTNATPIYETAHSFTKLKEISFEGQTFADVAAVNSAIAEKIDAENDYQIDLSFKNCSVTNNEGSLDLPTCVHYATINSDSQIATDVIVTNYIYEIYIDMPKTNINVTAKTSADVHCYGKESNVVIAQNAKIYSAFVTGENSTIENNGEVERTIGIDGAAKSGVNNGECDDITFGKTAPITCDKTFTNRGTIVGEYSANRSNNNVVYAESDYSTKYNITIENYNSINYACQPESPEANPAAFFNVGSGMINLVVNCHNGSSTINEKDNWFEFYGTTSTILFKHCDTDVILKENGSELTFEALAAKSKYVSHEILQ